MASFTVSLLAIFLVLYFVKVFLLDPFIFSPLRRVPGPSSFAITKWRLAYEDWRGRRTRTIARLHSKYGPAVRIGPNEVSFNSLSALKTIYGPGSRFGRTDFYRMFDVYGEQNLFTFHSSEEHGARKKLLSHAYSKSTILQDKTTKMVEEKTRQYIELLDKEPDSVSDIFLTLHYYSLDNITNFIYGESRSTSALRGSKEHRALISDVMHPSRRRLSWCWVHVPALTRWLYSRTGRIGQLVQPILPMQLPTTYTGIRTFALHAINKFKLAYEEGKHDTTSDTLMFLIWALSLPENQKFQEKLRDEVHSLPESSLNEYGHPRSEASDRCTYLQAVIKETLRLYAPLPSSEPRSTKVTSVVDGYTIPPDTVVAMSPWILHRNPEIFKNPETFDPERWLQPSVTELNHWFWGFSSGGRMCIGMHLAMAEMTTLAATLYRNYKTSIAIGFDNTTPAITARVETFYDERFRRVQENTCLIKFEKLQD